MAGGGGCAVCGGFPRGNLFLMLNKNTCLFDSRGWVGKLIVSICFRVGIKPSSDGPVSDPLLTELFQT